MEASEPQISLHNGPNASTAWRSLMSCDMAKGPLGLSSSVQLHLHSVRSPIRSANNSLSLCRVRFLSRLSWGGFAWKPWAQLPVSYHQCPALDHRWYFGIFVHTDSNRSTREPQGFLKCQRKWHSWASHIPATLFDYINWIYSSPCCLGFWRVMKEGIVSKCSRKRNCLPSYKKKVQAAILYLSGIPTF